VLVSVLGVASVLVVVLVQVFGLVLMLVLVLGLVSIVVLLLKGAEDAAEGGGASLASIDNGKDAHSLQPAFSVETLFMVTTVRSE
jgi:hypothetical protein